MPTHSALERAAELHAAAWNSRAAALRSLTTSSLPLEERLAVNRELATFAAPAGTALPTGNRAERAAWAERQRPMWAEFAKADAAVAAEFFGDPDAFVEFMVGTVKEGR